MDPVVTKTPGEAKASWLVPGTTGQWCQLFPYEFSDIRPLALSKTTKSWCINAGILKAQTLASRQ